MGAKWTADVTTKRGDTASVSAHPVASLEDMSNPKDVSLPVAELPGLEELPGVPVAAQFFVRKLFPLRRRWTELKQRFAKRPVTSPGGATQTAVGTTKQTIGKEPRHRSQQRALRISEHVTPRSSSSGISNKHIPLSLLTYEFQSGRFDRKPSKQRGWALKLAPSGQSDFWCLYDATSLKIESSVQFGQCVELRATKTSRIIIGAEVVLSDRCIVQAGERVVIGRKAQIGPCCLIMDRNHHGIGSEPEIMEPVYIGEKAVLGECCVVLSGSVVRNGQVVAPYSVVTQHGIIAPPSPQADHLLSPDLERDLRFKLAYVEPAQDLPRIANGGGVAGIVDMRSIRVCGKLENILVSPNDCNYYRRPWAPPLFVTTEDYTITMGSGSFIHHSTQLHATGGCIRIGNCNIISWRVGMFTDMDGHEPGNIIIEDQCWISANSILLPGTHISRGCVIAAGSLVQGFFPPWSIVAGHPATVKATIEPFEGSHGSHGHPTVPEGDGNLRMKL